MTIPNLRSWTARTVSLTSAVVVFPHIGPYATIVIAIAALAFLVVVGGIGFPAVWSRKPPRRRSALEVLRLLLRK